MTRTERILVIGLLGVGASGLSFGEETFTRLDSNTWGDTYNGSTALFGAVIEQGGSSLESGFPTGAILTGTPFTNHADEAFTLSYDPSLGLASLIIGDPASPLVSIPNVPVLEVAAAGGTLDHIGIALSTSGIDQAVSISSIMLNNTTDAGDVSLGTGPALYDFAMTPPTDFSGGPFTLSGTIEMSWGDNDATPQISAEIIGADAGRIAPEPGTWALLGSALAGLGLLRRKRIV